MGKKIEAHDEAEVSTKQRYPEKDKSAKELQVSFDGLIPVDQLKEFIEGTIRSKIEGSSKSSLTYSKPYTPRIDSLKMPMGTYGDHLVKQFIRSLKGNAFDWYTDLEADSIDGWKQLEQEFLNRFYSTRRTQGVEGPPIQDLRRTKEKQEIKKGGKPFSKAPSKESMPVNVAPFKLKGIAQDSVTPKNNVPCEKPQRKLTLNKMQARQYLFLDSDVPEIFDDLLEANLIDLP
ncbi:UNVERIFIED_CONTAM: hypothetical protein Slati_1763200 [Sesamum latifolium]|uniref:Retrotransposon gag domain-containing protein n=1 Tax=Sesamum latifolium TaxID=2727402 RepID=A0AAW2WXU5_9LAMI